MNRKKLTLEEAQEKFPDAFRDLEKTIGGPFELDPAGYDVFYENEDGSFTYGNDLDGFFDRWNGSSFEEDDEAIQEWSDGQEEANE